MKTSDLEALSRARIVSGPDSVDRIGELAAELGASQAYVVTDPGIVAAGHAGRVVDSLTASRIDVVVFDRVREDPTTVDVGAALTELGGACPDLFVAVGGGSSIDVAKACNLLRAGGGDVQDYWGVGKAKGRLAPLIAIPTTAGTGSEVQSFALIAREGSHQKMACGDPQVMPEIAILDPALTVSMPKFVTACTGLDAIGHAVESAVTTRRNATSAGLSARAFAIAQRFLPRVLAEPGDLAARGAMQYAAARAGLAIENSMLGAAHSMANPLCAHFGLAHGEAVGLVLPHVVRFNAADAAAASIYAELSEAGGSDEAGAAGLAARLEELIAAAGFAPLSARGIPTAAIPELAAEAARQWTAQFNPRPVDASAFEELLVSICGATGGATPGPR